MKGSEIQKNLLDYRLKVLKELKGKKRTMRWFRDFSFHCLDFGINFGTLEDPALLKFYNDEFEKTLKEILEVKK